MSETLSKQFNAHIGSRVSYRLTKEGYFDKTGSVIITEDGQIIDLTGLMEPYNSGIEIIYQPQTRAIYTTETDYITIGEPAVSAAGVVSNFSDENWVEIDHSNKKYNTTFYITFTTPNSISEVQSIVHATSWFTLEIHPDFELVTWDYFYGKNVALTTLDPNTTYSFKIAMSTSYVKTICIFDPITQQWSELVRFLDRGTNPNRTLDDDYAPFRLGQKSTSTDRAFGGTIDLSKTYITNSLDVNNEISSIIYRPFLINVDSSNLICAPGNTLLSSYSLPNHGIVDHNAIADETAIISNKYYAKGTTYKKRNETKTTVITDNDTNFINYGNVLINENRIASGFDLCSYLALKDTVSLNSYGPFAKSWEWQFKFTYKPSTIYHNYRQVIFSQSVPYETKIAIVNDTIEFTPNNHSNGSDYNIGIGYGSTKLKENQYYWVRCLYKDCRYDCYLSEDGINFWLETSVTTELRLNQTPSEYKLGLSWSGDKKYWYPFNGEIDLNECYILVDNKLYWKPYSDIDVDALRQNQILHKKYVTNIQTVGNVVEQSGSITNFSSSNYVKLPKVFNPGSSNWEIVHKMMTGSSVSGSQFYFGCDNESGTDYGFLMGMYNGYWRLWLSSNGTSWNIIDSGNIASINTSTIYWVKLKFDGSAYTYQISTDNIYWTTLTTVTSSAYIHKCNISIGSAWSRNEPFQGKVFLEDTKIIVAGTTWWEPKTKLVEENKYIERSNNFTTTGNPSILDDGSATGFTTSDYIKSNVTLDTSTDFEIVAKCNITYNASYVQSIIGAIENYKFSFNIQPGNYMRVGIGDGVNRADVLIGRTALTSNTEYYLKCKRVSGTYTISYSRDGENWIDDGSITSEYSTSFQPIIGTSMGTNSPWTGIIDLNELVIKADDEILWKPYNTYEAYENFIKAGSITETKGNFRGFNNTNFLKLPKTFNPGTKPWIMNMCYTTGTVSSSMNERIFGNSTGVNFKVISPCVRNGKFSLQISYTGTSWGSTTYGTYDVLSNTKYWIRVRFTGTQYCLDYSLDNETWHENDIVIDSTRAAVGLVPAVIGGNFYNSPVTLADPCSGIIHLKDFNIYLDGQLFWQPYTETNELEYIPTITTNENFYKSNNLTITNGIASGFNTDNILFLDKYFLPSREQSFEVVLKCTTPSSLSGIQELFTIASCPILLRTNGTNWQFSYYTADSWYNNTLQTAAVNTTYWLRIYYYNNYLYVYVTTTKDSWGSAKLSVQVSNFIEFFAGNLTWIGSQGASEFWNGTIDLNDCYININGERWWQPYKEETSTTSVYTKYTIAKPYHDEEKPEYNNYRIVGNLTNDNGIYSGFNTGNYLALNIGESNAETSEFTIRVKLNSYKDYNDILELGGYITYDSPVGFNSSGNLGRYTGSGGWVLGSTVYPLNQWIWVKQITNGNTYYLYGLLDNDYTLDTLPPISDWTLENTHTTAEKLFSAQAFIGWNINATNEYFDGYIDLNSFKLLLNEKEYTLTSHETRNFNIVQSNGKFLISNKMAGGFGDATGAYGVVRPIFTYGTSYFRPTAPWYAQVKVILEATSPNYQNIITLGNRIRVDAYYDNRFYVWIGNNNDNSIVDGYYGSWTRNTWEWVRVGWDGRRYYLDISRDGVNYQNVMYVDNTHMCVPSSTLNAFGSAYNNNSRYINGTGLIDLKETYIWRDGEIVWNPYPDNQFRKETLKGFYVPDFEYEGQPTTVNAYRNILIDDSQETILGSSISSEPDVKSSDKLKENVEIGVADENVFTYVSEDELFKPEGYCRITFNANIPDYNIIATADDKMYSNPQRLYVKAGTVVKYTASKDSFYDLSDEIKITEDTVINLTFDKKEFKFTIDTRGTSSGMTATDTTYILPVINNNTLFIKSNTVVTVYWGDNTVSYLTKDGWSVANITHTYPTAGRYQITLASDTGIMPPFENDYTSTNNNRYKLISLDTPMLTTANNNLGYAFYYAYNLESICEDLFKYNTKATSLSYTFYYCQALKQIPENLLRPLINLTTCPSTFFSCMRISSIPENLFKYNNKVLYLNNTFRNTAITSIPENLFKPMSGLNETQYTFANIHYNINIPANLFKYNPVLENVTGLFANSYIRNTPDNLFKYNSAITRFTEAFANCIYLTINPNVFGDLATRFKKLPTKNVLTMYFNITFARRICYTDDPGTAPELWKCTYTNANGDNVNLATTACFSNTQGYIGYTYIDTYYGNKNLTNFWDIPGTWGGLSNVNLTVNVEN